MSLPSRVLGVIPARGGSKRIPRKNLRELCGKPLIQWTIEAANEAHGLTTFVISTEDYEIGRVAAELGAYVIRRPEELAEDHVSTGAVLKHALEWMGHDYDIVVCLHPTSPIRDPRHINQAIEMLMRSDAPSLASVECRKRTYTHNASIYALKTPLPEHHYSDQSIPLLMDRRHSVDIDTEDDFRLAEIYLGELREGSLRGIPRENRQDTEQDGERISPRGAIVGGSAWSATWGLYTCLGAG